MCAPNTRWPCTASTRAIEQARQSGMLGDNILGRGFRFDIQLVEGAGAFVCGEETALIASLEGYAGRPRPRPPFPAQKGLYGKPTNINNVETWYNIAPIVSKGPAWFSETGSTKSAGTKVFSLVGKITNTGLVEMPLGTPLKTFIYDVGEGGSDGKHVKAVQTGGPSGGCIPQEMFDTPVDYETLAQLGSIMGSGGMVVMDEDNCMVDVARYFIEFTHSESCGKCIPCRVGLDKSLRILNAFTRGRATETDLDRLDEMGRMIRDTSLCGLGQTRAQSAAHHHAALPPRVRGPHPRQTLPRRRVRRPGALALREQLPAAHEHSALPAALQGGPPRGCLRSRGDGQSAARLHRPRLPASLRQPLPAPHAGFAPSTCAKCTASSPIPSTSPTASTRWRRASWRASCRPRTARWRWSAPGPPDSPRPSTWRCWATKSRSTNPIPSPAACCATPCRNTACRATVIRREMELIRRLGVNFRCGVAVGTDITLNDLDNQYNAVFLAIGTWKEAWVYLPGTELKGVIPALLFLEAVAKEEPVRLGRKVAVIGGGNAAIDSARTALRMGAEVTVIYRRERKDMPAIREETDAAEDEGAKFLFLATPHRIVGDEEGNVKAIEVVKTRLGEFDASGRRRPVPTEEIRRLECDTVILAVGEAVDLDFVRASGLRIKENGTLEVDRYTLETSRSKFYAGGDLITGASNVSQRHGLRQEGGAQDRPAPDGRRGAGTSIDPQFAYSNEPPDEPSASRRHEPDELPARERVESFVEAMIGLTAEEALDEAARCLRCDIKDHH